MSNMPFLPFSISAFFNKVVRHPCFEGKYSLAIMLPMRAQLATKCTTLAKKKWPLRLCIKSEHCSYHGISKNQAWLRFVAAMREVAASHTTVPVS